MAQYSLLFLPGDGIGPEVVGAAKKLLLALDNKAFSIEEGLVGGASIDACGVPVTDEVVAKAKAADGILLGAVGGPKWAGGAYELRPEAGLLRLRKDLDLYANLRPAVCFEALADASTLKPEFIAGLDIMIVRELVGGIYFGEPRGISGEKGARVGVNTQVYTEDEIVRIARAAFDLATKRRGAVCSVEKSNVMESGLLWREVITEVHAREYAHLELSHMLADACGMELVRNPKRFDVIVTDNLFGDMLSDQAAMLTGSIGMLGSASIGAGKGGLYEPVHGSAPDIAGQGLANPSAAFMSLAMLLRYSLGEAEMADRIENALKAALDAGARTKDIAAGKNWLSTDAMTDAVIAALD